MLPGSQVGKLLSSPVHHLHLVLSRQLLDLFLSWDWTTYFADFGKKENNKYQRVTPATALVLLEKLKEADKKSIFGGINLNQRDRDRVKLREVVHKQLKQLAFNSEK